MRNHTILLFVLILFSIGSYSQKGATIREQLMEMTTYGFSDPDPVPNIGRIYPYFNFDGYTDDPEMKKWKMVVLENDYIKVYVCPDIGGKVWGAIEKSTGNEFLYFNHVVKFRNVAMRGPWTSGGLEFNFGDIGHIPSCATPVDYAVKENPDGSVSCVVGAIDLPSGTKWNVEVKVYPDKAYFETITKWFNNTPLPCSYYHWMNAAAKSSGNLEFIYPGTNWIGHGTELGTWPKADGRELNFYENNNFGSYKSYHVLNSYSDFFGGYYHDDDFGFGHLGSYDDKPGKKLWIWGLSDQGMIWEGLLTDDDGQYIEFQAGKLFNQAAEGSTETPFKHREFAAHDTDVMRELWFPLRQTGGMVGASEFGTLNIENKGDQLEVIFQALQTVSDQLIIVEEDGDLIAETINLNPLEILKINIQPEKDFQVRLASGEVLYSSKEEDNELGRPLEINPDFNWESAYGVYTRALELEKQRKFEEAEKHYQKVLEIDKGFLPALSRMSLAEYRKMNYQASLDFLLRALSIDTYHPESNYLYGLVNRKLGNVDESKSGFSISAASVEYRSASYTELAKIYLDEKDLLKSMDFARKALHYNSNNPIAYQLMAVALRLAGRLDRHGQIIRLLAELDGISHFVNFERYLLDKTETQKAEFINQVRNELPHESYIDLAMFYKEAGCNEEAEEVLRIAPAYVVSDIHLYELDPGNSRKYINRITGHPVKMVFPYRSETAEILESLILKDNSWKLKYYLGLICWNRGLKEKAFELFKACGDEPDEAVFYLSFVKMINDPEIKLNMLEKAYELDKSDWRPAIALAEYHLEEGLPEKALPIVLEFNEKYPVQSNIGLLYARILMELERYEDAVEFLEGYNVLPFEGATVGRDLYHQACIILAKKHLEKMEYRKVIHYAEKALEWPANLGVGRPYDVDESLENQLILKAQEGLKK